MVNATNNSPVHPLHSEQTNTQTENKEKAHLSINKAIIPIHLITQLQHSHHSNHNNEKSNENVEQSKKLLQKRKRTYFPTGEYTFEKK